MMIRIVRVGSVEDGETRGDGGTGQVNNNVVVHYEPS